MSMAPALPEEYLGRGWREVRTQSKEELSLPFFSVSSHNRIYEHGPTADRLGPVSAADIEAPPRSVFTTALEFDPPLTSFGVKPSSVFGVARSHAKREFARSVREDGLVDVHFQEARWIDRTDGTRARGFRYDVGFPLDPVAVLGEDYATELGFRDGGNLALSAVLWAAIWPTREAYAMAGGIYPVETIGDCLDREVGADAPAVDVDVEIDEVAHRKELGQAIQRIQT